MHLAPELLVESNVLISVSPLYEMCMYSLCARDFRGRADTFGGYILATESLRLLRESSLKNPIYTTARV